MRESLPAPGIVVVFALATVDRLLAKAPATFRPIPRREGGGKRKHLDFGVSTDRKMKWSLLSPPFLRSERKAGAKIWLPSLPSIDNLSVPVPSGTRQKGRERGEKEGRGSSIFLLLLSNACWQRTQILVCVCVCVRVFMDGYAALKEEEEEEP